MGITSDDVRHVARLARLSLDESDVGRMTEELGGIIEHIGKIRELDLDAVEPTTHALDVTNAMAGDEPHESLPVDRALANAPDAVDGTFRVPQMRS